MTNAELYLRQQGIFNPTHYPNAHVTFVGLGGIGSFAAFAASKLGIPKITLIDPDVIEVHNQPNQMYSAIQAGDTKVSAMSDIIGSEGHSCDVRTHQMEITERGWGPTDNDNPNNDYVLNGLVVSGLDSMKAREDLWSQAIALNTRIPLYIDARISGELVVINAVKPMDLVTSDWYETDTLYSDDEGEDVSCTERGIIDVGFVVASLITRLIRRHYTELPIPKQTIMNQSNLAITQWGEH